MKAGVPDERSFASSSVPLHLARGVIGFGLFAGSVMLLPVFGPLSLLLAPLGVVVLRGCPTCWAIGLGQTISRGRLERSCADGSCRLTPGVTAPAAADIRGDGTTGAASGEMAPVTVEARSSSSHVPGQGAKAHIAPTPGPGIPGSGGSPGVRGRGAPQAAVFQGMSRPGP